MESNQSDVQQCLPLVLCPVYSVLIAEEPLRFFRIMVSVVTAEKRNKSTLISAHSLHVDLLIRMVICTSHTSVNHCN